MFEMKQSASYLKVQVVSRSQHSQQTKSRSFNDEVPSLFKITFAACLELGVPNVRECLTWLQLGVLVATRVCMECPLHESQFRNVYKALVQVLVGVSSERNKARITQCMFKTRFELEPTEQMSLRCI